VSEPIAGDFVLAPSPSWRRLLALAAALSAALATASIATMLTAAHPGIGLEAVAGAATLGGLYALLCRWRERGTCTVRLLSAAQALDHPGPDDAAHAALRRADASAARRARAAARWRRIVARPPCITLVGARAVQVSPLRIVLHCASGPLVIWRDAVDADSFRRLAVSARWARGVASATDR
jgi:hypothetical protein